MDQIKNKNVVGHAGGECQPALPLASVPQSFKEAGMRVEYAMGRRWEIEDDPEPKPEPEKSRKLRKAALLA